MIEEADESEYWLQLIKELVLGDEKELSFLLNEIDEIIRVVVSTKNSLNE